MKREDEEHARVSFDAWLSSLQVQRRDWEEVPRKDEPPDYYFRLGETRYAVEVTALMDRLDLGAGPQPSRSVIASISRFVREIESEAVSRGILQGAYIVSAQPTRAFREREDAIRQGLLTYIAGTKGVERAARQLIHRDDLCEWNVRKYAGHRCQVGMALGWRTVWEGESREELSEWLEAVLQDKALKLTHVPKPHILVVLDAYHLCDDSIWSDVVVQSNIGQTFHTVVRVDGGGRCAPLWSTNAAWWPAG
jgi:hypothetical protein